MRRRLSLNPFFLVFALLAVTAYADGGSSQGSVSLLMDGRPRTEYFHRGTTYVEAVRGREYSLLLTNRSSDRVAVALSVDGLNTIDARRSDAWSAAKWVLGPWETIEISGWQVSGKTARRFYFTGERDSYGAFLGKTEDLGVIEAVFYRERPRAITRFKDRDQAPRTEAAAPAGTAPSARAEQSAVADEYAATGMGGRVDHEVTRVSIDLDPKPIASSRIRYEFRPQLVKLGVLSGRTDPLERRERARGFDGYCPEP